MQTTLHLFGKSFGNDVSPAILLLIVPLGLFCQFLVFGNAKVKHVNHQISLLYSKSRQMSSSNSSSNNNDKVAVIESPQNAKMEIHAYFHHNFGLISLAGSALIDLPSEPGTYDMEVQTIKPIACTGMNERRCRLHSYFLGSSLDRVSEVMQPNDREGLITDGSGTIRIRVNVMRNYFKNGSYYGYNNTDYYDGFSSPNHREKMQETVDEVLSRVRRNKRLRMSRMMTTVPSSYGTSRRHRRRDYNVGVMKTKEEEKEEETKHQSESSEDI
jgi:hypothetical protein